MLLIKVVYEIVILSEESDSRSESLSQSKDPFHFGALTDLARNFHAGRLPLFSYILREVREFRRHHKRPYLFSARAPISFR